MGYIADTVSSHCFGRAVDLSLLSMETGELLDMGSPFDFFGKASHVDASVELIGEKAFLHRQWLTQAMEKFGVVGYPYEWWHFEYEKREVDHPMDGEIRPAE